MDDKTRALVGMLSINREFLPPNVLALMTEAADTIEAQSAELEACKHDMERQAQFVSDMLADNVAQAAEIERLREISIALAAGKDEQ
jgi:hypothetical protein